MTLQLNLISSFASNIAAIQEALIGCYDESIEARIADEAGFMAGTGNPLDDDHIALTRAVDYGLITNKEHHAIWEVFVIESRQY